MGSNSLLEGLVLGRRGGPAGGARGARRVARGDGGHAARRRAGDDAGLRLSIEDMTYSLKSLMWRQMGIVRRGPMLADAIERLDFWRAAVRRLAPPEPRAWELANMLTVARLAAVSALSREESRGTHYRADFAQEREDWRAHTLLVPRMGAGGVCGLELSLEPVRIRAGAAGDGAGALAVEPALGAPARPGAGRSVQR